MSRYRINWWDDGGMDVVDEFQSIRIDGYVGKWSAISKIQTDDLNWYYLFEHDFYGDETCYLVCRVENEPGVGLVVSNDEPFETYDGIIQCLLDEDIISPEDLGLI